MGNIPETKNKKGGARVIRIFSVISMVICFFASGCAMTNNNPTLTGFRIVTIIYTDNGGVFYRSVKLLNNGDGGRILFPDNHQVDRIVIGLFKDKVIIGRREIIIRNNSIRCLETKNCKSNSTIGETMLSFGEEKLSVYYHCQPAPEYMIFYHINNQTKGTDFKTVCPF